MLLSLFHQKINCPLHVAVILTNDKRAGEVKGTVSLIRWFIERDLCLLVDLQHDLFTIMFHMQRVPLVII